MHLYRIVAAVLAVSFAVVGLLFLFLPGGVLAFFNTLSAPLGFREAPVTGVPFYLVLASGYMYVVTLLAALMFRHPENTAYSSLLVHAKLASAILSLGFFIGHQPYLIYLVNFLVDGLIGLGVLAQLRRQRKLVG